MQMMSARGCGSNDCINSEFADWHVFRTLRVVSRHGAYQAVLSPPHPKAAIRAAADTLSAWLKVASCGHDRRLCLSGK